MKPILYRCLVLALAGWLATPFDGWGQAKAGTGGVRIVDRQGTIRFKDKDGLPLPVDATEKNDLIPVGSSIETKADGQVILLFSNGTMSTLEPNATLHVRKFEQEAFTPDGKKMNELQEEPSRSSLELELDFGTLIIGTPKLKKDSDLKIHTPLGIAGIRGTQFQISQAQGGGPMALDVTESMVVFTPRGAAFPTVVGPKRGLDVAVGGIPTLRAVDPVAAQQVTAANVVAVTLTAEVTLEEVTIEMAEPEIVEAEPETEPDPAEAAPETEPDPAEAPAEPAPAEPAPEPDPKTKAPDLEERPRGEREPRREQDTEIDETDAGRKPGKSPGGPDEPAPPTGPPDIDAKAMRQSRPQVNTDQVMENNPTVQSVRKMGELDESSRQSIKLGLGNEAMAKLLALPDSIRLELMESSPHLAKRLLAAGTTVKQFKNLLSYVPPTRDRIMLLRSDDAILNLLEVSFPEKVIEKVLTDERITALNASLPAGKASSPPPRLSSDVSLPREVELADSAASKGNYYVLPMLEESTSSAQDLEAQIDAGILGNLLLTDLEFQGSFLEDRLFQGEQLMNNPYYKEASSTLREASAFSGLTEFNFKAYAGRNVIMGEGFYDFAPAKSEDAQTAVLSASENLDLLGAITLSAWSPQPTLVLMSGNEFTIHPGASIAYPDGNLALVAGGDLSVNNATLVAGEELSLKGLRNVTLKDATIEAKRVRLEAASKLSLETVGFRPDLSSLYLQATTVNLRNLNFPSGSQVNINSLKGGLDGKYPNFGSQAFGRVNFIEQVKYGDKLMNDRPSFDLHGKKVMIGKIPQP